MPKAYDTMMQAADLNRRLHGRYGDRIGYKTIKAGRESKWIVSDGVRLPKEIVIPESKTKFAEAAERLLEEMIQIARLHKLWADERESVIGALSDEAQTYVKSLYGAGPSADGVRTFGKQLKLGTDGGKYCNHVTKEELIHASASRIEVFRYFPSDEKRYATSNHWAAAMNWNHSMYHYVEVDKLPPSVAHRKLTELQQRLVQQIADSLYPSASNKNEASQAKGATGAQKAKSILEEIITVVGRR